MKKIIMLSVITTVASSNTMFGMLLVRHSQRLASTGQKRYTGGAEINNQQIMEQLEQQRRLLKEIYDYQQRINPAIEKLLKSQSHDNRELHLVELPEGKHPLISTIRTGGALY